MKHPERFIEFSKTYKPYTEGDKDIPETTFKAMVTTVKKKLEYIKGPIANYIDIVLQKEATNQVAKGDILIYDDSGNVVAEIAKDVPVSALLQYERLLSVIRNDVYNGIPTIDTNVKWTKGDPEGDEIWVQDAAESTRNKNVIEYDTMDVGEKFAKKVIEKSISRPVGTYTATTKSGALSPSEKSEMLGRIDKLIEAVKLARAKANTTEVVKAKCGIAMMKYING
jgi:hypothetical protein